MLEKHYVGLPLTEEQQLARQRVEMAPIGKLTFIEGTGRPDTTETV
jgi:hypothetical protein